MAMALASTFLLFVVPPAHAAVCVSAPCPDSNCVNVPGTGADCTGGKCVVNAGNCVGGNCTVNAGDCHCYVNGDSHAPCKPSGPDCGLTSTDREASLPPHCGCVVNTGTCNGACTVAQGEACSPGGNCVVNVGDCSGQCTNFTYPAPAKCADGGDCVINTGLCGAGCSNFTGPSGPTSGCGGGGSCTINTGYCDGFCSVDQGNATKNQTLMCSDGGSCPLNVAQNVCRREPHPAQF